MVFFLFFYFFLGVICVTYPELQKICYGGTPTSGIGWDFPWRNPYFHIPIGIESEATKLSRSASSLLCNFPEKNQAQPSLSYFPKSTCTYFLIQRTPKCTKIGNPKDVSNVHDSPWQPRQEGSFLQWDFRYLSIVFSAFSQFQL